MKQILTFERFDEIQRALALMHDVRSERGTGAARVELRAILKLIPLVDGKPRPCVEMRLRAMSRTALEMTHTVAFSAGHRFIAKFEAAPIHGDAFLICTVAECRGIGQGFYQVEMNFTRHTRSIVEHQLPAAPESTWSAQMVQTPIRAALSIIDQQRIQDAILR